MFFKDEHVTALDGVTADIHGPGSVALVSTPPLQYKCGPTVFCRVERLKFSRGLRSLDYCRTHGSADGPKLNSRSKYYVFIHLCSARALCGVSYSMYERPANFFL